jgi:hypothetical protein
MFIFAHGDHYLPSRVLKEREGGDSTLWMKAAKACIGITQWQSSDISNSGITINIPVVFMARYVMILRGATSLRGALERVGPENRDFFGP